MEAKLSDADHRHAAQKVLEKMPLKRLLELQVADAFGDGAKVDSILSETFAAADFPAGLVAQREKIVQSAFEVAEWVDFGKLLQTVRS